MTMHPLAGSIRTPLPGARAVGKADPSERMLVTVIVRCRSGSSLTEHAEGLCGGHPCEPCVSREEFAQRFGADSADLGVVKTFADLNGLKVEHEDAARRTVMLSGTVAQFNRAFSVDLERYEHPGGEYRGRIGPVHVSQDLVEIVVAVLGLDNRPQAHAQYRIAPNAAAATSFSPLDLAKIYDFPASTGAGECIAIVELGGGYAAADLQTYFKGLGVTAPSVATVAVDGGSNAPTGDPNGPDAEVMLDIEVAGAIAPGASIVVYFAPNTDAGFLDAITTAVHDTKNKPSVVSISWGGPESSWTAQSLTAFDQAFQAAATLGVTICIACGDNGSDDGVGDGADHVDFPASSSYALACGGTSLTAASGKIKSETVWNDGAQGGATGGGVSGTFALPAWQKGLASTNASGKSTPLAKRGVPDVAGDADPQTGYNVRVDGTNSVVGGTSAVAPLWAGLIARLNAIAGKPAGLITPSLYANATAFNDVTSGNNGDFAAAAGWDACTGLGSPDGAKIAAILQPTPAPPAS